jgi:hypothetical protein
MTLKDSISHSFNLMVTAVLFFGGIAFGTLAFSPVENDWLDRIDDIGLPLIGIACLVWFLIGRNRYQRSAVPLVLVALALLIQIAAIPLERDDLAAFGDNIGGLMMLVPFFFFSLLYYRSINRTQPAELVESPTQLSRTYAVRQGITEKLGGWRE